MITHKKILAVSVGVILFWVAVLAVMLSSCNVVRRAHHDSSKVVVRQAHHDTSAVVVKEVDHLVSEKETKDTAVGIAGGSVSYTADTVDIDTVIKAGNLTLRVSTDRNGKRRIECKADSLTLIIRNLVRENTVLRQRRDSSSHASSHKEAESENVTTLKEVVVRENAGWLKRFGIGFKWLLIGVLIGYAIRYYQKFSLWNSR